MILDPTNAEKESILSARQEQAENTENAKLREQNSMLTAENKQYALKNEELAAKNSKYAETLLQKNIIISRVDQITKSHKYMMQRKP